MIPVNTPLFGGNELEYVTDCIKSGWISSEGPYVERFEEDVARYSRRRHGIAVVNGTAALQVAVQSLNLPPGSEVILPAFSIISCAAAIARAGLIPVPVDCDRRSFNIEAGAVESAISSRTSAIMLVHTYGLPVDVDPILSLAKTFGLKVIEDAAEVFGQTYKNRPCGSLGDVSILSFYPNKQITTGEGGMILTDSDELASRARLLRNLAFQSHRRFVHNELGWNFRMSNLQAAVGCAQLEKIESHLEIKYKIGEAYNQHLKGVQGVSLPLKGYASERNLYWVYTLVLDPGISADADMLMARLAEQGIGTRPMFWPVHRQPVLLKMFPYLEELSLPESEYLAQYGIYLPSGLGLDLSLIPSICEKVHHVLQKF